MTEKKNKQKSNEREKYELERVAFRKYSQQRKSVERTYRNIFIRKKIAFMNLHHLLKTLHLERKFNYTEKY